LPENLANAGETPHFTRWTLYKVNTQKHNELGMETIPLAGCHWCFGQDGQGKSL
jgi:hypothetical protein